MKDESQSGQTEPDNSEPATTETGDRDGQAGSQGETATSESSEAPTLVERILFAFAATAVGVFTTTIALIFRPSRFVGLVKGEGPSGNSWDLGAAVYFLGSMVFCLVGLYYAGITSDKLILSQLLGEKNETIFKFIEDVIDVLTSGNFNSIFINLLPAIVLVIVTAVGLRLALFFLRGRGTFDMALRVCFYTTGVWLFLWGVVLYFFNLVAGYMVNNYELGIKIFYSFVLVGPLAFTRVLFSLSRRSFDLGRWRGLGALLVTAVLWAGISIPGYFAGKTIFVSLDVKDIETRETAILAVAGPIDPSPGMPGEPQMSDNEEWPFYGYTNSIGLELLWCRPGTFQMGSLQEEKERENNETRHEVELTRGFWLGRFEVTQAQWTEVMAINPSENKDNLRFPVTNVTWHEAKSFCERLTEREKAAGRLPDGWTYDLPTEAQWEYACRGGTDTPFSFGSVLDGRQANCDGGDPYGTESKGPFLGRTTAVGVFPANDWGFHDMHGNVREWCLDWYGEYEPGPDGQPVKDPSGPATGDELVRRGGGWRSDACVCRSANRSRKPPNYAIGSLGFRVALSSRPPGQAGQDEGGPEASEAALATPGE